MAEVCRSGHPDACRGLPDIDFSVLADAALFNSNTIARATIIRRSTIPLHPAAISIEGTRCKALPHLPRFRALALLRRRLTVRGNDIAGRHPRNLHRTALNMTVSLGSNLVRLRGRAELVLASDPYYCFASIV